MISLVKLSASAITLALMLILATTVALAQGTYTQIDDPFGVNGTFAQGINNGGDIVGQYQDSTFLVHGFVLSSGSYTTVDYPGALYTYLTGINDTGQIVGYAASTGGYFGFMYDIALSSFTLVNDPDGTETMPNGINNSGVVVGIYIGAGGLDQSFEFNGTEYRSIQPPNATNADVYGIAASGKAVGIAGSRSGRLTFLFEHGHYKRLVIPGSTVADVYGINQQGNAVAGMYEPTGQIGFILQNGILTTLQVPESVNTIAYGVNDSAAVVGYFEDPTSFLYHGFLWTLPAGPQKRH